MNILDVLQQRYATKKFAADKKISKGDFDKIKALLRYSPSSINSQPWHFIIADNDSAKTHFSLAAHGPYQANESKIKDASHVVLFCAKTDIDTEYLKKVTDQEDMDGRFATLEAKQQAIQVRQFYLDLHKAEPNDVEYWSQNQVYMNWGTVLLGAGMLGIDAVPIEGVDLAWLNNEFKLIEKGFTALGMLALGYRAEDDFNAKLPKSRLPDDDIFTFL